METLVCMVTFGCNIPLFTFAYDPVQPIRFPGYCLDERLSRSARWLNVYAPADLLGYPLRPVQGYAAVVHEDRPMAVGSWFRRHTPLSHLEYWNDARFQDYLAHHLRDLLRACTGTSTGPAPVQPGLPSTLGVQSNTA